MFDDFFWTVTPWPLTRSGSCGRARFTRFWTCTCAMSGSVSSEKKTVIVSSPLLELVDVM